ncbi:MAG: Rpn family recombination-promoting nuclease/putative transposase [Lachnospiraceae bacterium]|nr:Rpn family recombination-promoting nuclease/putative transposase [Lachnospiraceae bacterium]
MSDEKKGYERKPLEEMNVIDDFLFEEIMSDRELGEKACRIILSCVLKRNIEKIRFVAQRAVPGVTESSHGICLDTYVEETEGGDDGSVINVFDIEPDKQSDKKKSLPKRSRYYADLIDTQILKTGADYEGLPELITIFILSYDPFGENAMYYEAESILKTHPQVPYNDGVRRIFLYVKGKLPERAEKEDRHIQNLLRYINESREENVTDENTRDLDQIVKQTKANPNIGVRYMKSWERDRMLREEGRKEGREEGQREERANTEAERRRADMAEARVKELEALLKTADA